MSQASEDRAAAIAKALQDVAARAVAEGWPVQAFMAAAQQAYLAASPELQEELEAAHLLQHIEILRRAGRVADA
jgi:7,8-dihydro-6-hydroxymethylpterin-pyrophosphokinase